MIRRPPRSTRTDTLFPYTTLFRSHARRLTFWLGIATLVALAAVSAATPFLTYDYWHRWFVTPGVLITAQVPLLTAIIAGVFFWSLRRGGERSEERRVGKECVSTCRSRGSPYH